MNNRPVTDIAKFIRSFRSDDSLERTVGVMQMQNLRGVPVVDAGRVLGMLTESDALAYIAAHPDNGSATVGDAMNREPVFGNVHMPLDMVAEVMGSRNIDCLPIIDEYGGYRGVVSRPDLLAGMLDIVKPPQIAGLATPIGVRLTTGSVTAGAGTLGLFLSGAAMVVFWVASVLAVRGLAMGLDAIFGTTLALMLQSPSTRMESGAFGIDLVNTIASLVQAVLWLIFFRLSPVASFHAAEHQVVHTIEAGEPLTPEAVAMFPRAHPRCGTNLMVVVVVVLGLFTLSGPGNADYAVLVAIVLLLTGWWRTLGYLLQQYFTTKPAGPRYIHNGIKVGEELLAKVKRREVNGSAGGAGKLWNMGLPQVALGMAITFKLVTMLTDKLHIPLF